MDAVRWEDYRPLALHMARRFTRQIRCQALRDEVVQAALVGLWRASIRWRADGGASFATYAAKAMWGCMTDWLRTASGESRHSGYRPVRKPRGETHVSLSALGDVLTDRRERPPGHAAELADDAAAAVRLIDDPRVRLAARLYWIEGMTQNEIAEALGCSGSNVSLMLDRALAALGNPVGVLRVRRRKRRVRPDRRVIRATA